MCGEDREDLKEAVRRITGVLSPFGPRRVDFQPDEGSVLAEDKANPNRKASPKSWNSSSFLAPTCLPWLVSKEHA